MFFELDPSLATADSALDKEKLSRALQHLGTAYFEGQHVVSVTTSVLEKLLKKICKSDLSRDALAGLQRSASRYAEIASLKKRLSVYVSVTSRNESSVKKTGTRIDVPYIHFQTSGSVRQSVILCEHGTHDVSYYLYLAKVVAAKQFKNAILVSAEPQHGGGSSTYTVMKSLWERGQFVICIVDSDRAYPDDTIKGTAKKCVEGQSACDARVHLYVTQCRSVENLLTQDMMSDAGYSPPKVDGHIWKFMNFKNGVRGADIVKFSGVKGAEIWSGFGRSLASTHKLKCRKFDDCSSLDCGGEFKACDCVMIDGYGDDFVSKVIQRIDRVSPGRRSLDGVDEAQTIGEIALAWTCAERKRVF